MSSHLTLVLRLLSVAIVAGVWEIAGRAIDNPIFFVPLSAVGGAAADLATSGALWTHFSTSLVEFILGFSLACVVGIGVGVLMSLHPVSRNVIEPWIAAMYTVPIIAIGPLFIVWLGLGIASKVAIVFLVAVFPIVLNTHVGMTLADPHLVEAIKSFGANALQIYTKVRMPAAVPAVMTGLRVGVRGALVAIVVAELFGSRAGLGFLVLHSAQSFQTADLFVGVLALSLMGIVSFELIRRFERAITPWRIYHVDGGAE